MKRTSIILEWLNVMHKCRNTQMLLNITAWLLKYWLILIVTIVSKAERKYKIVIVKGKKIKQMWRNIIINNWATII
jgi:hypothetical protein